MIKHSKYKNTGILFEMLVRQITNDILEGKESKAVPILKKYFVKTELGKEYKLYEFLNRNTQLTEGKADIIINTIVENAKNLNRSALKRQKYNLIKEIKSIYNLEEVFKHKILNYKTYASLYTLLEICGGEKQSNPQQLASSKINLLEYLTSTIEKKKVEEDESLIEFKKQDRSTKILTYKLLLEKFNEKYSELNKKQKLILKEFITSIDNKAKLKEFYNKEVKVIKEQLEGIKIEDKVIQIKLDEIKKFLTELDKNNNIVKEDNLYNLLKYYELLEEIQKIK